MFMECVASASSCQASKSPTLPIHAYGDEEHAEPDDGDDGDDDEDDFDADDEEGQ